MSNQSITMCTSSRPISPTSTTKSSLPFCQILMALAALSSAVSAQTTSPSLVGSEMLDSLALAADASYCGTQHPPAAIIERDMMLKQSSSPPTSHTPTTRILSDGENSTSPALCIQCIEIETVFHVIEPTDTSQPPLLGLEGDDAFINHQLDLLNTNYDKTPFHFRLTNTTHTRNDDWALGNLNGTTNEGSIAYDITAALRQGGSDVANIFLVPSVCALNLGGFATFPLERGMFPSHIYSERDHIFLCPPFVKAVDALLTHEMGHFLGLLHPWGADGTEDVCDADGPGDLVDDTPMVTGASRTCGNTAHICPTENDEPGIATGGPFAENYGDADGSCYSNNFMDYSTCMTRFTPGQIERMHDMFNRHRRRIASCDKSTETEILIEATFGDLFFETAESKGTGDMGYLEWWKEAGYLYDLVPHDEDHQLMQQLRNRTATRTLCFPRYAAHEFFFEQIDSVVLKVNGRNVMPSTFSSSSSSSLRGNHSISQKRTSIWVAADTTNCASRSRFSLDLTFDLSPETVHWELRESISARVVASASDTFAFGSGRYFEKLAGNKLVFDHCVEPNVEYEFVIWRTNLAQDFVDVDYLLSVNGDVIEHNAIGASNGGGPLESVPFLAIEDTPRQQHTIISPILCFSASSTVQVQDKVERMRMDELSIGDAVHVGEGVYEPVYSFGHYSPHSDKSIFLQLTSDTGAVLEISQDHMVFTASQGQPIPASLLNVGDKVLGEFGDVMEIVSIETVTAKGKFAPFTPSGKLIVDGFLVSSFVTLNSAPTLVIFGVFELSFQWLAHAFEFPHRLSCYYFGQCPNENYTGDGISTWVAWPLKLSRWILEMDDNSILRNLGLGFLFLVMMLSNILEYILLHHTSLSFLACSLIGVMTTCRYNGISCTTTAVRSNKHETIMA